MNIYKLLLSLIFFTVVASPSFSQSSNDAIYESNVVTNVDIIVSNVPEYVSALKANSQIFKKTGSNLTGFCQPLSGAVPGEATTFTFYESMEAAMQSFEFQRVDPGFQRFSASLAPFREFSGRRLARVIRPYDGELYETWAMRNMMVRTENPDEYIAAAANLESAMRANGFSDFSITIQQEIGSGDTSELLVVVVVAPSLARLGAAADAIYQEPEDWARTALAAAVDARSQIVDDKFYRCEQVYLPM